MRLDKYICKSSELSRSEAKRLLKSGLVTVDNVVVKKGDFQVSEEGNVAVNGESLSVIGTRYIMAYKPEDMICSNVDEVHPSILHLFDVEKVGELKIAGRLDVDTTGLVLLSDDGKWTHNITSPNKQCKKVYRVVLQEPLNDEMKKQLEAGVQLHGENELTKPAQVEQLELHVMLLTIVEGKYHQVKRMCAAVGNKVIELHRQQIGSITLDDNLEEGEWRYLTEQEIAEFL